MGVAHRSRDDDHDVLVIDALWEARPPFSAIDVVKGHSDALKQWGLTEVMGDDYGAGLVRARRRFIKAAAETEGQPPID